MNKKIDEVMTDKATIELYKENGAFAVSQEVEVSNGVFKCSYKTFAKIGDAKKFYDKAVAKFQNMKQKIGACGIFARSSR